MLIQFTVENFLSIRQTTTFSLRATSDSRLPSHVVTNPDGVSGKALSVLRAAALYGANGSGKSNLVQAIKFAQTLVLDGVKPGASIAVRSFKLDADYATHPSRFEFIFRHEGILFSYGFAVDTRRVHEEWLFGTAGKRELRLFERVTDEHGKVRIEFGSSFRQAVAQEAAQQGLKGATTRVDNLAADTRPNQLFLTACIERNVAAVASVREWFNDGLEIVTAESMFVPLVQMFHHDHDFAGYLGEFLRAAGTGVESVETQTEEFDFDKHFPGVTDWNRAEIEEFINSIEAGGISFWKDEDGRRFGVSRDAEGELHFLSFFTLHRDTSGQNVRFRLDEESDGTQRLFDLVPLLFTSRRFPKTWIVDEIDRRLHPLLTRLLVKTALNCPPNAAQSQFIFTTHDTNLLDLDLLRRDEIWFVEKDEQGATHLASLAEWKIEGSKVRPDLNIEKGYLSGRFGAIPFIGDPSLLFCDENSVTNGTAHKAKSISK